MAEDALCTHEPGRFLDSPLLKTAGKGPAAPVEYGTPAAATLLWDDQARERMKAIPAFVRGMVVRAVEDSCRKEGRGRVTLEALEAIRARMPVPKVFRPS
jgi:hypothetical protein